MIKRTGQSKIAVVGWGRGMGHKGHMYLADAVITQAQAMNADPYFFVSKTVGKDDPIYPEEKVKIYQRVFPQKATIFTAQGNLNQALNDLAGLGYQGVVVVVGADQKAAFQYLEKPNKEGVPIYQSFGFKKLKVISRQETKSKFAQEEGPRATPMRQVLLDPNSNEEARFKVWRRDMPEQLGDNEVLDLMHKAEQRMMTSVPAKKVNKLPKVNAINKVKSNKLKEQIQRMRPFMKEATAEQKYRFLQLMKESLDQVANKEFLDGTQRSRLLLKLLDTGKYDLDKLSLLSSADLVELYRKEFTKVNEISFFKLGKSEKPVGTKPKEVEPDTTPNDYHSYFKKEKPEQEVYRNPGEFFDKNKVDPLAINKPDEVEEARILDPLSKVDVYYIGKDGKSQQCYKGIPYKYVDKAIDVLRTRYSIDDERIEVRPSSNDEYTKESLDYLEEK